MTATVTMDDLRETMFTALLSDCLDQRWAAPSGDALAHPAAG